MAKLSHFLVRIKGNLNEHRGKKDRQTKTKENRIIEADIWSNSTINKRPSVARPLNLPKLEKNSIIKMCNKNLRRDGLVLSLYYSTMMEINFISLSLSLFFA